MIRSLAANETLSLVMTSPIESQNRGYADDRIKRSGAQLFVDFCWADGGNHTPALSRVREIASRFTSAHGAPSWRRSAGYAAADNLGKSRSAWKVLCLDTRLRYSLIRQHDGVITPWRRTHKTTHSSPRMFPHPRTPRHLKICDATEHTDDFPRPVAGRLDWCHKQSSLANPECRPASCERSGVWARMDPKSPLRSGAFMFRMRQGI
jgi:hypothetical protein